MTGKWIRCLGIILACVGSSAAQAVEPFCVKLEQELKKKIFTAKVALYDTEIGPDMIYHLERDAEEIRKGDEFVVAGIDCDKKTVEMKLKPLGGGDKVEIRFFLSRKERQAQDGRKLLEKMMGYVIENEQTRE